MTINANELSGEKHNNNTERQEKYDADSLSRLRNELTRTERIFNDKGERDRVKEREIIQKKINEFISDIENKKELQEYFSKIFKTEKGSIYLIAEDGSCLRIKKHTGKTRDVFTRSEFSFEPVTSHIHFINDQTRSKIEQMYAEGTLREGIKDIDIPTIPYDEITGNDDVYPFDFGILNYVEEINTELEDNGNLKIKNESFGSGFHLGHKITEIIK